MTTSVDAYDKVYAKYSNAIEGRTQCDPPPCDPPDHARNPEKDVVTVKVGLKSYQITRDRDVTQPKVLLSDVMLPTSGIGSVKSITKFQDPPPELIGPVASRDDDITLVKESDQGSTRDDTDGVVQSSILSHDGESVKSKLDRFNAKRMSMRSVYGAPLSSPLQYNLSSGGDPPCDDIDSRLAFLKKQSMVRRATIFPPKSTSIKIKSTNRNANKSSSNWDASTNKISSIIPASSPLPSKRSLAMRIISEQILDGYRMSQEKCSDCTMNIVETSDGNADRKCVFCPINDFRAIIQGAVSNRVMAAKRIQGQSLIVSEGTCEHCYSPIEQGISCEVCPILDDVCIEVAKAIGRGGIIAKYSYCNDCGSQHVKIIGGMQCIVCNVLNKTLGEKQVYKPGKAFASSPKSYQDTLDETAHLLETIKSQDNTSVQIQLDEELVKAKQAQSLLGTTISNIAYESKTNGVRNELKAELLKAREAQLALQKMLEVNVPPNNTKAEQEDENKDDLLNASGISDANSQREVDQGNVKEYIPPPKHFFQRGIPKHVWVEQTRGDISVGTSYYTDNLRQNPHQEQQHVADCCGVVRIHRQASYDEGTEYFDDGSIGTNDQYTTDVSLNSYSTLSADETKRKHHEQQYNTDRQTTKRRSRGWSIFDLCGRPPSFDTSDEQTTDFEQEFHAYSTGYRRHRSFSENEYPTTTTHGQVYQTHQTNFFRRDDESSHASMYSNITPHGILKSSSRFRSPSPSPSYRSPSPSFSVKKRLSSAGNSVSSGSEYRKVTFYRDHDIDKLKTLTEEGDDSLYSYHPNPAVDEVMRTIQDYKNELAGRY